jgi:hypothetical protein
MANKIVERSLRAGREARDKLLGDGGRDTANKIFERSLRAGRETRDKLLGDGGRDTANKIFERSLRAGRETRDKFLTGPAGSIRRATDRLIKKVWP